MSSLRWLLDTLGPHAVVAVAAGADPEAAVSGVAIHDPLDHVPARQGDLVLGVGVDQADAVRLLPALAQSRAAGLVLKLGQGLSDPLAATAERTGVPVLALPPGADWAQFAALVRTALAQEGFGAPGESLGGVAAGDLFALANAVAAMVDAPVTVEDPQSRVLAFSLRQDEADEPRRDTIVGRQIPQRYLERLTANGVFARLRRENGVVLYEDPEVGVKPRAVIGVKAGDEFLGSIWAAFNPPLRAEQEAALVDASKFVAIHLLRHRIGADVQRGLQTNLVAAVLEGGRLAGESALRLGLGGEAFRVLAIGLERADDEQQASLIRHWDLLAMHVSASHKRSAVALVGGAVYAVLPTDRNPERGLGTVRQTVEGYLKRTSVWKEHVLIGIGGHASGLGAIPRSRHDADQALRVLRMSGKGVGAAEIEDVRMHALLLELGDLHAGESPPAGGKLGRLLEHDRKHRTGYLETLRAYLDAFGDTALAADQLRIHPNTFRYRLRKLQEVSGIDLADPQERVGLLLQVRLLGASDRGA